MSRGVRILAATAAVIVIGTALAWDLTSLQHWLAYETGSRNTSTPPHNYNFYSGFGSIVLPPVLNGLAVGAAFWWHHQCHVDGCFRYARRTTAAGDRACWKHHPEGKLTVADLRARHHLYLGSKPGRG